MTYLPRATPTNGAEKAFFILVIIVYSEVKINNQNRTTKTRRKTFCKNFLDSLDFKLNSKTRLLYVNCVGVVSHSLTESRKMPAGTFAP